MRRIGFALALYFAMSCISGRAEDIQLKDGSKVTGKIIATTDETFQIKTAYGNIQVPRSEIVSINFPENQPTEKSEGNTETAATPVEESLEGLTYTNKTARFKVNVPQGWSSAPALRGKSKDIIAALQSQDQTLFLFVTPEVFSGTLNTYRVLAETQYQIKFKDYEKLGEIETQLDGKAGLRLIWHGKNTSASDAPLKSVVYIIPYDGRMVRLSFLTLEPLFDTAFPVFEKIAASYRSLTP